MFGRPKRAPKPPPPPCPDCGKRTNLDGRFCRACGWDADLAESKDAYLDGVKVPEAMDDDAYEDLLAEEGLAPRPRRGRNLAFTVAAVVLLLLFAWSAVAWR